MIEFVKGDILDHYGTLHTSPLESPLSHPSLVTVIAGSVHKWELPTFFSQILVPDGA